MSSTLQLLCCENIVKELQRAAALEHIENLEIISFPSYCDMLRNCSSKIEVSNLIPSTEKPENLHVMACKTCPVFKNIVVPEEQQVTFSTVFSLFLDEKLIQQKISQGGYLVTQGWLLNWRRHVDSLGFTKAELKNFFVEFAKKIVYIDSLDEPDFVEIYEFAKEVGLPYEHIPIKLDYLRLCLKHLYLVWKMKQEKSKLQSNLQELTQQAADYAAMLNIVNELSIFTTEREVIDRIITTLTMLFGASKVSYHTAKAFQEETPDLYREVQQQGFAYCCSGKGFVYGISFRDDDLGFFQLEGFFFEQYIERYINFCLQTAKVLAIALINIRNYKKIIDMSMHDSLTGLYNRDYYEKYLAQLSKSPKRGIGIVVCDVDNLKLTNDTVGHKAGDQLLLRTAEILRKSFRATDVICRIGGDEFAVFVKDCNSESVSAFSKRLEDHISQDNEQRGIDPEDPQLSFSYGFAYNEEQEFDSTEIFKLADQRMYQNKRKKKQR